MAKIQPKIPDEGLCLSCIAYAKERLFWGLEEELKKRSIPAALAKDALDAAVDKLYQNNMFFCHAIDQPTADYIQAVLTEYKERPEIRYPLVMRCAPKPPSEGYGPPPPVPPQPPPAAPAGVQMPTKA